MKKWKRNNSSSRKKKRNRKWIKEGKRERETERVRVKGIK